MATIKSYTDIEQSKKLAKILPIESADMHYNDWNDDFCVGYKHTGKYIADLGAPTIIRGELEIPCWSLAALLEQFPHELCDDDGNSSYLEINKEDDVYQLVYTDPYGDFESIETDRYEHFIDACYVLILKLHELNLL